MRGVRERECDQSGREGEQLLHGNSSPGHGGGAINEMRMPPGCALITLIAGPDRGQRKSGRESSNLRRDANAGRSGQQAFARRQVLTDTRFRRLPRKLILCEPPTFGPAGPLFHQGVIP